MKNEAIERIKDLKKGQSMIFKKKNIDPNEKSEFFTNTMRKGDPDLIKIIETEAKIKELQDFFRLTNEDLK